MNENRESVPTHAKLRVFRGHPLFWPGIGLLTLSLIALTLTFAWLRFTGSDSKPSQPETALAESTLLVPSPVGSTKPTTPLGSTTQPDSAAPPDTAPAQPSSEVPAGSSTQPSSAAPKDPSAQPDSAAPKDPSSQPDSAAPDDSSAQPGSAAQAKSSAPANLATQPDSALTNTPTLTPVAPKPPAPSSTRRTTVKPKPETSPARTTGTAPAPTRKPIPKPAATETLTPVEATLTHPVNGADAVVSLPKPAADTSPESEPSPTNTEIAETSVANPSDGVMQIKSLRITPTLPLTASPDNTASSDSATSPDSTASSDSATSPNSNASSERATSPPSFSPPDSSFQETRADNTEQTARVDPDIVEAEIEFHLEKEDNQWVETALDLTVGGNYYGLINVKYGDGWIELIEPQEALYLLPSVQDRQALLPLFEGRIVESREIPALGTLKVDLDQFALVVTLAPEQTLSRTVNILDNPVYEGAFSAVTRLAAAGSESFGDSINSRRLSANHYTRLSYYQHRLIASGSWNDLDDKYDLRSLQSETDIEIRERPLTLSGGLLTVPGQPFASSVSIVGVSVATNRERYIDNPLLSANRLEVFVPTRALVEVFRNSAASGDLIYSRMMDFGNVELDTSRFPSGSYPVEIVVSVEGVEQSRQTQQFYKYQSILPREQIDLNLSIGSIREQLDIYSIPVAYGSFRKRLRDWLEGSFSAYLIDDRLILNQGIKGFHDTPLFQELSYDFNLSQSSSGQLLGYQTTLRWRTKGVHTTLDYFRSLDDTAITHRNRTLLTFPERERISLSLSGNTQLWDRPLSLTFNARRSHTSDAASTWRIGPGFRYTAFNNRDLNIALSGQHDWTDQDSELRLALSLTWRLDRFSAGSTIDQTRLNSRTTTNWQNSLRYEGDQESPGWLKQVTARAQMNTNQVSTAGSDTSQTIARLDGQYTGNRVEANAFYNRSSSTRSGSYGGELASTLVAGSDDLWHITRAVQMGTALVAITLNGEPDPNSMVDIQVGGGKRDWMRIGETRFIEVPIYKTTRIELKEATQNNAFLRIMNPVTQVTPYPGNVLRRTFHVARLMMVEGRLIDASGEPIADSFFESGDEPAYTDSDGYFIVEMPIQYGGGELSFIARRQLCRFEVLPEADQLIANAGDIQCESVDRSVLDQVRAEHDRTRSVE